jgi:hypothetical protein
MDQFSFCVTAVYAARPDICDGITDITEPQAILRYLYCTGADLLVIAVDDAANPRAENFVLVFRPTTNSKCSREWIIFMDGPGVRECFRGKFVRATCTFQGPPNVRI